MFSIEWIRPLLGEGPAVAFVIPVPEFLKDSPFVMDTVKGHGLPVTNTVTSTWFVMLVLFLIMYFGTRNISRVPGKLQSMLEAVYQFLDDLLESMVGKWKVKYISYISTLFLFIFFSNILSFFPIPGISIVDGALNISPAFRGPTADLNTTVGLALLTTFVFISTSMKINGVFGYVKGLAEPVPVMFPVNVIGELAKPTNISIRLFGNMFAGGIILGLLYSVAPAVIPVPLHIYFDLFSGVVQSFVFVMLTIVYIQGSLGDAEFEG